MTKGSKTALCKIVGARIKSARSKKGVTLEKLAYGAEISKGNLSEIENGLRDPRLSTLCAIAECLEVSVSDLLKGIDLR